MKVQLIRGQITTTDKQLGETVDLLEALTQAAADHIAGYGEQP